MGIDITLRSVLTAEACEAIGERLRASGETDPDRMTAAFAETGAYFRDPYNCFGLLPMLEVDLYPLLAEDDTLPIDAARELLVVVESRPLTLEHVKIAVCGSRQRPLMSSIEDFMNPTPITVDEINWPATYARLTEKREQLIALLRRSIELNEPLECSL
jgi:hypothetical protein